MDVRTVLPNGEAGELHASFALAAPNIRDADLIQVVPGDVLTMMDRPMRRVLQHSFDWSTFTRPHEEAIGGMIFASSTMLPEDWKSELRRWNKVAKVPFRMRIGAKDFTFLAAHGYDLKGRSRYTDFELRSAMRRNLGAMLLVPKEFYPYIADKGIVHLGPDGDGPDAKSIVKGIILPQSMASTFGLTFAPDTFGHIGPESPELMRDTLISLQKYKSDPVIFSTNTLPLVR
jgi:hypothetical protein